MVPKHRRFEIETSLASVVAPANSAEFWPEAVGYGQAAGPTAAYASLGPAGNGYPASTGYNGTTAEPGWTAALEQHAWQAPEQHSWQDWQNWGPPPAMHPDHPSAPVPRVQLPADHPSGPMPAVRAPGAPDLPQRRPGASARTRSAPPRSPDAGDDNGNRRLYAVPNVDAGDHAANALQSPENLGDHFPRQPAAGPAGEDGRESAGFQRQPAPQRHDANGYQRQPAPQRHDANGYQRQPAPQRHDANGYQRQPAPQRHDANGYQRQPAPQRHDANGYQRQSGPAWQETADYRRETSPYGPGPGPTTGRFRDDRSADMDSLWTAGQVLTLADGQAAQIAQDARDYAAAIREAAEREAAEITRQATDRADAITQQATGQAAAIREAVEREAAELRASLDSMSGELNRVAAYVTENLHAPAMPATAPALPGARPALPGTSVLPDTRPARPGTSPGAKPARPATSPGAKPVSPARPKTTPARPSTTPTKKPQTHGRQRQAMRIATAGTAALLSIAAIGAVTYTGIHGFSFFAFRESGQGETPGSFTDANFLAGQKECPGAVVCPAAQHHDSAPKGRHHKAPGSK